MKQVGTWLYLPALYEREADPVLAELNLHEREFEEQQIVIDAFEVAAISGGDDENQSFVYLRNGLTFRIKLPHLELAEFIINAQTQV